MLFTKEELTYLTRNESRVTRICPETQRKVTIQIIRKTAFVTLEIPGIKSAFYQTIDNLEWLQFAIEAMLHVPRELAPK